MTSTKLAVRLMRSTILTGVAAATAFPAFAQDEAVAADEEILVTGTRITRADLNAPSPVTQVTSQQLLLVNTVNSEQFLNTLPQVIPSLDQTSNNPGNGTASVSLRGLGTARTLVLIDGARFVPDGPGSRVDLNAIPTALVERIDVVTGGSSAVYGSDAVAGVVNFILKDDFEGVQFDITDDFSAHSFDANTFNTALTMGGNFADGRGNAVFFASYTNRQALLQGERKDSFFAFLDPGAGNEAQGFIKGGSSGIPGTRFRGGGSTNFGLDNRGKGGIRLPSTNTNFSSTTFIEDIDPLCGSNNANSCFGFFNDGLDPTRGLRFGGAGGVTDLYNYAPTNYLQLPQERYNISGFASFEINDHIELYARGIFSESIVDQQLAPTPAFLTLDINLDNPAIPSDLLALIEGDPSSNNGDGTATIRITKRFEELGPRNGLRDGTAFQQVIGVRGDLNEQWTYDAFFNFSRSTVTQTQTGNLSVSALQAGILCDGGPTALASGCDDPFVNIFGGPGSVSPEGAAFINRTGEIFDEVEQTQAVISVSGDLDNFRTPWADHGVALVVGAEYRENFARSIPDSVLGPDVRGFNSSLPVGGRYDVYELFGETQIPIITGMPFIESFVINGSYRYSDYSISRVGGSHTFAVGGDYSPIPDLRFRAQFQRAVRAPNIGELFSAFSNNFPGAQDPCSGGTFGKFDELTDGNPANGEVADPAALTANCIASGVPGSQVGAAFQSNSQIEVLTGGNPDLFQETGDTLTIGFVYTPDYVPGLNVQVDFFDIDIKDAITVIGLQTIFDECLIDGISGSCSAIAGKRNPSTGEIAFPFLPNLGAINAARVKSRGIDGNVSYQFDVPQVPGSFTLQYYGSYTLNSSFKSSGGADTVSCEGEFGIECGEPTPEYKHTAQFGWLYGPLTTSLRWRALSSVDADDSTIGAGISDLSDSIGWFNYLDVTTQFELTENFIFTAGVRNITGKDAPVLGSTASEQANTFPATYTPFGRQVFVGGSFRF